MPFLLKSMDEVCVCVIVRVVFAKMSLLLSLKMSNCLEHSRGQHPLIILWYNIFFYSLNIIEQTCLSEVLYCHHYLRSSVLQGRQAFSNYAVCNCTHPSALHHTPVKFLP
jgi:hypothetical protein